MSPETAERLAVAAEAAAAADPDSWIDNQFARVYRQRADLIAFWAANPAEPF